jgi:hypothetical protein
VSDVSRLQLAKPPAADGILRLLDELRSEVESGRMLSLVAIPVFTDREFAVRAEGEISVLELSGLLLRATLDATGMTCR